MLVRIAESLFWLGRYLERADDTARILEVHLNDELEHPGTRSSAPFLSTLGLEDEAYDGSVLGMLAWSPEHANSISYSINAARRNAGSLRELLPSEVYESISAAERLLVRVSHRGSSFADYFRFVRLARERVATVVGLLEESYPRDQGWWYLRLGTFLERVDMTVRLLSFRLAVATEPADWITTLKYSSAYEFYLRTYRGVIQPAEVLEFLLVDRLFPRSVHFGLLEVERCLEAIGGQSVRRAPRDPARRIIGRARSELAYLQAPELDNQASGLLSSLAVALAEASDAIAANHFATTATFGWHASGTRRG